MHHLPLRFSSMGISRFTRIGRGIPDHVQCYSTHSSPSRAIFLRRRRDRVQATFTSRLTMYRLVLLYPFYAHRLEINEASLSFVRIISSSNRTTTRVRGARVAAAWNKTFSNGAFRGDEHMSTFRVWSINRWRVLAWIWSKWRTSYSLWIPIELASLSISNISVKCIPAAHPGLLAVAKNNFPIFFRFTKPEVWALSQRTYFFISYTLRDRECYVVIRKMYRRSRKLWKETIVEETKSL